MSTDNENTPSVPEGAPGVQRSSRFMFPSWVNFLPLAGAVLGAGGALSAVFVVWFWFSPKHTDVGYRPEQPIPYSHELHAGQLGIDCRYCHTNVEQSPHATVPPTQVCMNCHKTLKRDSGKLEPLWKSWESGEPVEWVRIHKLADYAYFDHSVHVNAGVGCVSCHGRIDTMVKVSQREPLSMGWCLDCHRAPEQHLRPKDQVTNMVWQHPEGSDPIAYGTQLREERGLNPPEYCGACHR